MQIGQVRGLYCITPEYTRGVQYERMVRSACVGGADVVQFRTKNLDVTERVKIGRNLRRITSKYKVPFIVNDDLPLALYINTDGVHLGQDDLPLFVVRKILKIIGKKNFFVGVSTHSLKDAVQAEKEGASYISVGPIYFTPIKSERKPVTVGLLSRVKKRVKVPVIAIGGINHTNIDEVLNAGADGVAG